MNIKEKIKSFFPSVSFRKRRAFKSSGVTLIEIRELVQIQQTNFLQNHHPNPLNSFGKKCFSQTDEDGITLEILRRIDSLENGVFAEFGVGNGTENNTLILKALGWRGFWVGGEDLAFEIKQPKEVFSYFKDWITLENITKLAGQGKSNCGSEKIDVISLDLDGNDIYFVERLLSNGYTPKLFIVEYNPKFPPPIKWQITYDSKHVWDGDDYFGASLASFKELFNKHSYRLICCNSATGSNAFFIKNEFSNHFNDVPTDINCLYVAPRHLLRKKWGALKTIANLFA